MTELKMRLLGDRVSRRRAWQIARDRDWDELRDAEYLAIARLQAVALVTVDPNLAASPRALRGWFDPGSGQGRLGRTQLRYLVRRAERGGTEWAGHSQRVHVLAAIEGLGERALDRVVAPSGMVTPLLYDVELFWMGAGLGAARFGIPCVCDGCAAPTIPGPQLRQEYSAAASNGNRHLGQADVEAEPQWWPHPETGRLQDPGTDSHRPAQITSQNHMRQPVGFSLGRSSPF